LYDVIISGAGPSGSKCADIIAQKGFKVALIERDVSWRKPCGGSVNKCILDDYPQLLKKITVQKINGAKIFSPAFDIIEEKWDEDKFGLIVDRLEFDNYLRDLAVDSGVELFDKNVSYDFIIKNQQKIGIKTRTPSGTKEYYGKVFIVADGMSSKLALRSGLRKKWNISELSMCKCALFKTTNLADDHCIDLFFRSSRGYGWVFPLGNDIVNVGMGIVGKDNLEFNLNVEFEKFKQQKYIKDNFLPDSKNKQLWCEAFPVAATGVVKKIYDDNIMIIGDAAGMVCPANGEGLAFAVRAGKRAAEVAVNAFEKEDFSRKTLKEYRLNPEIKKMIRKFKIDNLAAKSFNNLIIENHKYFYEKINNDSKLKRDLLELVFFQAKTSFRLQRFGISTILKKKFGLI